MATERSAATRPNKRTRSVVLFITPPWKVCNPNTNTSDGRNFFSNFFSKRSAESATQRECGVGRRQRGKGVGVGSGNVAVQRKVGGQRAAVVEIAALWREREQRGGWQCKIGGGGRQQCQPQQTAAESADLDSAEWGVH